LHFLKAEGQIDPGDALAEWARPGKRAMKRLLLATLLMAAVGSGYYYRHYFFGTATDTRPARPPPAQPVVADVAAEMSAPIEVAAIGNVQSIATVMVKSRIDGEIAQVHFEEGQDVNAGDLLFSLDDRVARAQLQQSEANLERDRAQLRRFQLEVARQTGLANRGIAPAQKLEDVTTSQAVFEATVRASEAAVETARINLNFTTIRAPITGRTGSVALKRGNVVKAVDTLPTVMPMVTITQLQPIYVTFTVPERHLGDLRAALVSGRLPVVVTAPGSPQNPIAGQLTFIDNQVDAATGTISLKATFTNDDARLWPGQFVYVAVTLGVQANAVAVPNAAIQVGQNGPYVFVIKPDSTVELRLVRVDRTVTNRTVIAEGLQAGDRVVVDGQLRLTNGTRVAVQRSEGPPPPQAQPIPVAEQAP
jgi:multidrug efflux system membrane fusion protein